MKISLSKPWITESDIEAVEEVMKTQYLSLGSKLPEFEGMLSRIVRRKYASLFGCSARTAYNDLQEMVSKNILQRKGKGKQTYYELL